MVVTLGHRHRLVAGKVIDLLEDVPRDKLVERAKELRKGVEDALRNERQAETE